MNISDIIITSIETLTAFDVATGDYLYTLDELQNVSIANTQETSEITGKQGRKLANLKRNKGVTISGASGIVSGGLMESQTGSKFETKATDVMWTDYLDVDESHKATTRFKAVGTTGAEIVSLRLKATDGTPDKALEQGEAAEQGKFKYDPLTKELEFSEDVQAGQEIIVQYKRKLKSADVLVNESDTYSGKAMLYVDAMCEDKCANVFHLQFFFPKVDFSGEFTIELGDNQTVHNFEAESLAGSCGAGGSLWTYTIFGENAEDVNP